MTYARRQRVAWGIALALLAGLGGCQLVATPQSRPVGTLAGLRCTLSPSRTYVTLYDDTAQMPIPIYHLLTQQPIVLPVPADTWGVWLPQDRWLAYTTFREVGSLLLPTNGWVVDIQQGVLTDVTTLPLPDQQRIFTDAERELQMEFTTIDQQSPNGQYIAFADTIRTVNGDLVQQGYSGFAEACRNGWAADSRTFYFIDGANHVKRTGPLTGLAVP